MVNQIPVPQAKYELLTDVRQPRWKSQVLCLSLILLSVGALFVTRAWTGILVLRSSSSNGTLGTLDSTATTTSEDAKVATWLRRARMYAESAKENQNADRNTSVGPTRRHNGTGPARQILVCYYTVPGHLNTLRELGPSHLDPDLCTHLIVGFASVVNSSLSLPGDDALLRELIRLRNRKPGLRIMVSAGGSSELRSGFSVMVRNHANRKKFIKSVLNASRKYGFDGLDLDWEFPAWLGADERERIRFAQLLEELRREFDRSGRDLLLSVAVAAPQAIVDQSYIVPDMAQYVDFVSLMSYDYHFYVWYFPVTGLNAALFARGADSGYLSTLNVNFSAEYWISKGMPREKLIIGIPTYGHSYLLDNPRNHGLMAPSSGIGKLGSSGFVDFTSVCEFLSGGASSVFEEESKVPYAYEGREWVSYDDRRSVSYKADWIRENGFGGAMILSLNVDDWSGGCFNETFPLTRVVAKILKIHEDNEERSF